MNRIPGAYRIPLIFLILALALWAFYAWEIPLVDVLPQEAWTEVQVRSGIKQIQGQTAVIERKALDSQLQPFLDALQAAKVSRDDSPSKALTMPYLEFWIYCGQHPQPTLLYIQSNGDIAFAVHMDTDHYQHYEGGQALYRTLVGLGFPVEK